MVPEKMEDTFTLCEEKKKRRKKEEEERMIAIGEGERE